MVSFKNKTINAFFWSFTDNFVNLVSQFIVGIILARILSPREFGLIGMLTIFIAISQSFIDSGFSNALIRKKDCTQKDYSTVFFFNLAISLLCYLILFLFSRSISNFFDEPLLESLIKILGLGLVLNSFGIIQRTILIKNIDFKLQTKVTLVATAGSSILAIFMAIEGFGVWSLIALTLTRYFLVSFLLWVWSRWKPSIIFSKKSFNELFFFGSKLLVSSLIETAYQNLYYLVIGKFFSAADLGFYSRADQFQSLPSGNLQAVIGRVSFPVLANLQDDSIRLKDAFKKVLNNTMFLTFILMIGLAAIAKPLIIALLGIKWEPSVVYLQLLCFVGMFYPFHALNLNLLQVKGRSDLFLKIEVIKKLLAIPIVVIGISYGIIFMIFAMIVHSLVCLILNGYWTKFFIGYSIKKQIIDVLPSFIIAIVMGVIVYGESLYIPYSPIVLLMIQLMTGLVTIVLISEILNYKEYKEIKSIIKPYLRIYKTKSSLL